MREGALRVQGSVESIAAVSEQTAAGAEEVSASTEEQSASAEQMSAGAQELAALATGLKELVQHFTLDVASASPQVDAKQNIRAIRVA
jgi:methyl-accepting chemotaxis protein